MHKEFTTAFAEGDMPLHTLVSRPEKDGPPALPPEYIQQTFGWPNAGEMIAKSRAQLLIAEVFGRTIASRERVHAFNAVLRALIELTSPVAVSSTHARVILNPLTLFENELTPHVNVRFYKISNSPGDMIMDTIGLHTLGLKDLQCHFRQLPPQKVAPLLFNAAVYVFEGGNIQNGHAVEGISPDQKWRCQTEKSILKPFRDVLDLNPGLPFAAGNRN